jgi:hypothetical protein
MAAGGATAPPPPPSLLRRRAWLGSVPSFFFLLCGHQKRRPLGGGDGGATAGSPLGPTTGLMAGDVDHSRATPSPFFSSLAHSSLFSLCSDGGGGDRCGSPEMKLAVGPLSIVLSPTEARRRRRPAPPFFFLSLRRTKQGGSVGGRPWRPEEMAAPAWALSPARASNTMWARRRRGAPRRCFAARRRPASIP